MPSKKQEIYSGYDSYLNIEKVLKAHGAKKPFMVCDSAFEFLFVKDYIKALPFPIVFFSDFTPNPLYEDVVKGVNLFRENGCDFIVSIGGGSAIDVAKCIKLYAKMPDGEVYLKQEYKDSGIPHMAIPTTAGTGSESTRYAVCYYEGAKQSVTHESIIPDYVILEPAFLKTLPVYQKKATLLDALCQGIESLWSVNSNEESYGYSEKAIRAILSNLEAYMKNDEKALEQISLAANLSGRAINITQTTAAHAMSYKITSLYGLAHGHACAVCLPYVWRYMIVHPDECIDARGEEHLQKVFKKLCELFYVDEPQQAVYRFFRILQFLEMPFPTLKNPEDMETLVSSVNPVRLKNNPVALDRKAITEIYTHVFKDGNNFQKKNIEKFLKKCHTTYEVEELQKYALENLLNFDRFCKAHGLRYYLTEGTLLGAVRNGGFVPWDDDVDVCMARADYDRFLALWQQEGSEEYLLDCFETNQKHWTLCAKLQMKAQCRFSLKRLNGIALSLGPSIDIFALDSVPAAQSKEQKKTADAIRFWRSMLWLKTGYSHDYSTLKWRLIKLLSFVTPLSVVRKRIQSLQRRFNAAGGEYYVNYGSLYKAQKETWPKAWFEGTRTAAFEGHELPIPQNAEAILKAIYGDYMKLPPYSMRFPKHSYFVNTRVNE